MRPFDLSITEFIRDPRFLNDTTNSICQDAILKSAYGEQLTEDELKAFKSGTGRVEYVPESQKEISIVAGRRGGKTSKIGARTAIYQAYLNHETRGQRAEVLWVAPTLRQAQLGFDYILNDLRNSPELKSTIENVRQEEIELDNGITIRCVPCSSTSVRGFGVVGAVLDEFGFFRNELTSVYCDKAVLDAIRPAMITYPYSKLWKITTPGAKRGQAWEEYSRRAALPYFVWRVSTAQLNPSVPVEGLERMRQLSPEQYRREFEAEFTDSLNSWLPFEAILSCIIKDRDELPYMSGVQYSACIDAGFRDSDFAMAISHRTESGEIFLDLVRAWSGTREVPLAFRPVLQEVCAILRRYNITMVVGDQFCERGIQSELGQMGIRYEPMTFTANTRYLLFSNLQYLIRERRIELLDHPRLLDQLKALEEEQCPGGRIDVRPGYGKDDLAVALALSAFQLSQPSAPVYPSTITRGRATRPWENDPRYLSTRQRYDDYGWAIADTCERFPQCFEANNCPCHGIYGI